MSTVEQMMREQQLAAHLKNLELSLSCCPVGNVAFAFAVDLAPTLRLLAVDLQDLRGEIRMLQAEKAQAGGQAGSSSACPGRPEKKNFRA
jgi:hypothetical protein